MDKIPEEVDEILKIGKKELNARIPETNNVSMTLFWIGILEMLIAFIVGIMLNEPEYSLDDRNWNLTLICWGTGFISGMTFIGFAEVIKLLQKISDK